MTKMIYKAFSKKFFGAKYERLPRTLLICLVVFWGLYLSHIRVQIAPFIFYLMTGTFTAGVMWQALSSEDNASFMENLMMLPFGRRDFTLSYIAALGTYVLFTKTGMLLAVLLAVGNWKPAEVFTALLWGVNGVLMTAGLFPFRKYWYAKSLWVLLSLALVFFFGNRSWFALPLAANGILAFLLLRQAEGYSFYLPRREKICRGKTHKGCSVWRYLFRYLTCHRNYLVNTAVLWCMALLLPLFIGQRENRFAVPMGFALLSMNTPICILLSCDPALEQALHSLPGQKKAFCLPYCLFIFLCNLTADGIFLFSLQVQKGGVGIPMIASAFFFAFLSAAGSVLLEWFYPIRKWKIESDLWHHPRKYAVPSVMLLLAAAFALLLKE